MRTKGGGEAYKNTVWPWMGHQGKRVAPKQEEGKRSRRKKETDPQT